MWEEVTGHSHSQESGDARGQPWQGLGLHVRTGAPNATSRGSFPDPGWLGAGAGYGLARGPGVILCATCSPQASCWVAEDMLLAGPERAFVAAAPAVLMTGSWARQPQTTSRGGRPGGAAPPGSSRYGLTWGLMA